MTDIDTAAVHRMLLQHQIEQWLYHEAQLLDERRYEDWLGLLADDIRYWVPVRTNRTRRDQDNEIGSPAHYAHFDENLSSLQARVRRIGTGMAWAEEPPSRTRRTISNVIVEETETDGEYAVRSNVGLYRNRGRDDEDMVWAGRSDLLRRSGQTFVLAQRTVIIDQSVILAKSFSSFL